MIGSKCIHIESDRHGIITSELKGNGEFPDQWGICWVFKYDYKVPNHYYWNDKDKIKIFKS